MSIPKDILVVALANKLVFVNLFEQEPVKIPTGMFFGDPGMPSVPVRGVFGQQFDPLVFERFSKFATKIAKMTGRSRPSSKIRPNLDSAGSITPM